MIIFAVLAAVCCALGFSAIKVYEWRQDVLYGPYIVRDDQRQ